MRRARPRSGAAAAFALKQRSPASVGTRSTVDHQRTCTCSVSPVCARATWSSSAAIQACAAVSQSGSSQGRVLSGSALIRERTVPGAGRFGVSNSSRSRHRHVTVPRYVGSHGEDERDYSAEAGGVADKYDAVGRGDCRRRAAGSSSAPATGGSPRLSSSSRSEASDSCASRTRPTGRRDAGRSRSAHATSTGCGPSWPSTRSSPVRSVSATGREVGPRRLPRRDRAPRRRATPESSRRRPSRVEGRPRAPDAASGPSRCPRGCRHRRRPRVAPFGLCPSS